MPSDDRPVIRLEEAGEPELFPFVGGKASNLGAMIRGGLPYSTASASRPMSTRGPPGAPEYPRSSRDSATRLRTLPDPRLRRG